MFENNQSSLSKWSASVRVLNLDYLLIFEEKFLVVAMSLSSSFVVNIPKTGKKIISSSCSIIQIEFYHSLFQIITYINIEVQGIPHQEVLIGIRLDCIFEQFSSFFYRTGLVEISRKSQFHYGFVYFANLKYKFKKYFYLH